MTVFDIPIFQGNGIIKRLQGEVRGLVGKIKVKNTVTVSQERILKDTSDKLQVVEKELENTQKQLLNKEEQVCHTGTLIVTSLCFHTSQAHSRIQSFHLSFTKIEMEQEFVLQSQTVPFPQE